MKEKKSRDDSELCERPLESVSRRGIIDQIPRNPKTLAMKTKEMYKKKDQKINARGDILKTCSKHRS
jgi:hypothetical protein